MAPDAHATPLAERVDVCICTYRRASITSALESLAAQKLSGTVQINVIVADNDVTPSAQARVEVSAQDLGLDVRYVHAPAQNISVARNACIEASDAPWFAFMDDDEVAAPDWIERLLAARDGADVIFGVARARYGSTAPRWMVQVDLHSNDAGREKRLVSGYTSNVLIRRAIVDAHRLRFDPALGRIGGEDTIFFYDLYRLGARLKYAADALVMEDVEPHRQNLRWILRRRYRAGQTHAHLIDRFHPDQALANLAMASAKALYSLVVAIVTAPTLSVSTRYLARAVFHAGVVQFSLRKRFYAEYGGVRASVF
jgi:succinoglycan biosynthesis protein ExoM